MADISNIPFDFPSDVQLIINEYFKEAREKNRNQIKIITLICNDFFYNMKEKIVNDKFITTNIKEYRVENSYLAKIKIERQLTINYLNARALGFGPV